MLDLTRTKRIIYIAIGITILGVVFFIASRYFAPEERRAAPQEERVLGKIPGVVGRPGEEKLPEEIKPGEAIEIAPKQTLVRITDFPVIAPQLNREENKVLFYKKDGGDLLSSDLSGKNQEKLSNITVVGMIEAFWSPLRDRAAIFYLDGEAVKGFLHIGTSSVAVLPQNIKSFSWTTGGKSLVYLLPRGEELDLVLADQSGKGPRTIFSTPLLDARISWASQDRMALGTAPSGLAEGYLFMFSRASGAFNKIAGPLFGMMSLWSGGGERVLVGSTDSTGRNIDLALRDSTGRELLLIGAKTLPEKCVFAETEDLYCAVPRAIPAESRIPDDYLRGELNTADRIFYFNLKSRKVLEVFSGGGFDMTNLVITKDKSHILFVNRLDGTLWGLKLK